MNTSDRQYYISLINELRKLPVETEWVEFKVNNDEPYMIGEYLSAISNSAALHERETGYVLYGIHNTTHEIVGSEFYPKLAKVGNEELENWLLTQLTPRIDFRFVDVETDEGHVVVIEIPAARIQPTAFKGTEFIRVGSYKKKLKDFPEKERKLWRSFEIRPYETLPAKENVDAGTITKLLDTGAFYTLMQLPIPSTRDGIIYDFLEYGFLKQMDNGNYAITNMGALLFAKRLTDFDSLRRKQVRVVVYRGRSKIDIIREQTFDIGYAIGFENMITWINSQLPANEEIGQALRTTTSMYPPIAIREIVANMIVHQDFSQMGFPMVEIYSDRIEISNPGQPIISVERFIDEYDSRNSSLADLMRRLGVCEELGSGLDKAISSIELYQLPPLRIQVQESRTTVTIFAYRKYSELDRQERIYACYQHACLKYVTNEKMTNQTLRERMGIDKKNYPMASRIIKDSIDAGKIKEEQSESKNRRTKGYIPYWA